jgi:hypothetical protein
LSGTVRNDQHTSLFTGEDMPMAKPKAVPPDADTFDWQQGGRALVAPGQSTELYLGQTGLGGAIAATYRVWNLSDEPMKINNIQGNVDVAPHCSADITGVEVKIVTGGTAPQLCYYQFLAAMR